MLYVAGEGGVLVSYDDGGSWQRFPSALPAGPNDTPTPPGDGGGFPTANVTDLDLALGNIQPTTGRPDLAGPYDPVNPGGADPDTLLATTFGRGQYAIRLAPVTFPSTVRLDPKSVAGTADDGTPAGEHLAAGVRRPELDHRLQQRHPDHDRRCDRSPEPQDHRRLRPGRSRDRTSRPIGRVPPAGSRSRSGPVHSATEGLKTIEIYATDDAGAIGNKVTLDFHLLAPATRGPDPADVPADDTGITGDNITIIAQPAFHRGDRSRRRGPSARRHRHRDRRACIQQPRRVVYLAVPQPDITRSGSSPSRPGDQLQGLTLSPVVNFTIKAPGPDTPPNLTMLAADDSGVKGDDITNVVNPHFTGVTDPGVTVELLDGNGQSFSPARSSRPATPSPVRSPSSSPPRTRPTGQFTIQAKATNADGSTLGNPLTFTIDTRGRPRSRR